MILSLWLQVWGICIMGQHTYLSESTSNDQKEQIGNYARSDLIRLGDLGKS